MHASEEKSYSSLGYTKDPTELTVLLGFEIVYLSNNSKSLVVHHKYFLPHPRKGFPAHYKFRFFSAEEPALNRS